MRFIYFSLALTLGLLVPWTNCQNFSWPDLYNSTSASPTSYPTTPSPPSIYNQTADVISEALHVIIADIIRRLDPWLIDNFYVSFEDILNGDIEMSTIEAWAEALIDYENNEIYMMQTNHSLPMEYYQQTFDQKYEQLMSNIANMLVDWFKDMMGGNGGWDWGNDNSTDTTTTTSTPTVNSLLNRIKSVRSNVGVQAKPAGKKSNGGKFASSNNSPKPAAKKATIGGRLARVALSLLRP